VPPSAGPGRASAAAQAALASSSLLKGLRSAQGVVYSISGDTSLSLYEVAEISEIVQAHVGGFAKANVLFAASADEHMQGRVQVTVIAAGLPEARLIPAEKGRQMARATMVVGASRRSSSIMWSTR
jgi:cell division GTPase FtsZ